MTRVIGVDQSYTGFGYCNGFGSAFKQNFPNAKYLSQPHRLVAIRDWYIDLLKAEMKQEAAAQNYADVQVFMEGYAFGAKVNREILGELGGVVKVATLEITGHPPTMVPPTVLKKFVTSKGNAKKNEMLLGVYKQWGVTYADDNVADAYALRQFGLAYLGFEKSDPTGKEWTQYQLDAVKKAKADK